MAGRGPPAGARLATRRNIVTNATSDRDWRRRVHAIGRARMRIVVGAPFARPAEHIQHAPRFRSPLLQRMRPVTGIMARH
jgi:hypothetical protein